jgi:hypothetical protein
MFTVLDYRMASKRSVVEEGNTPGKPVNKRQTKKVASRKTLFPDESSIIPSRGVEWTDKECAALTSYICLYWTEAHKDKWPTFKKPKFWEDCAEEVNKTCNSSR